MFFVQLALTVLVWAATIVVMVRRRDRMMAAARAQTRGRRSLEAIGLLLASTVVLALTMLVLARGGLTKDGFTPFGWAVTALAGAAFVALQTMALVPLVLNAVTVDRAGSSDTEESHRT
ncbi:hypothetical protein EON82_23955 [bacterium]|nr:MAG: hypothetical protein EON82_23955 [bacterium]